MEMAAGVCEFILLWFIPFLQAWCYYTVRAHKCIQMQPACSFPGERAGARRGAAAGSVADEVAHHEDRMPGSTPLRRQSL